jgi:hypothetical protein
MVGMDWIEVALDIDWLRDLVNAVMNISATKRALEFLATHEGLCSM